MKMRKFITFMVVIFIISSSIGADCCNRTCGTGKGNQNRVPYPFGFSDGCQIRLNCSEDGGAMIDQFEVQNITGDSILIGLPADCNRSIPEIEELFGSNYAPTWQNGFMLKNCTVPADGCMIPSTMVEARFGLLDCGAGSDNISCYSAVVSESGFMSFENLTQTTCRFLFSSIAADFDSGRNSTVSLRFQAVELGWWLDGPCACSTDAVCTNFSVPDGGGMGFRCHCVDGFVGEGFAGSGGCRRVPYCSASKYMSGDCGERNRVGVLIGAIALIVIIVSVVYIVRTKRGIRVNNRHLNDLYPTMEHRMISYQELRHATNDFCEANLLGFGSYGSVYKGVLSDGTIVAVKVLNLQDEGAFRSFDVECEVLRTTRHRNLIRVITTCSNPELRAIVMQYMSNGTLEKWLYNENNCLNLLQRVSIMTDVALALEYLHCGQLEPVVHCDLKPSNVLLDEDMVAHVADFGIAKILAENKTTTQTKTLGTIGYLAPEYGSEGRVSMSGDLYSYGIMLLETFTGKKPTSEMFSGQLSLRQWVSTSLPDNAMQVADSRLLTTRNGGDDMAGTMGNLLAVLELGLECSRELPAERSDIKDVVGKMTKIKKQLLRGQRV